MEDSIQGTSTPPRSVNSLGCNHPIISSSTVNSRTGSDGELRTALANGGQFEGVPFLGVVQGWCAEARSGTLSDDVGVDCSQGGLGGYFQGRFGISEVGGRTVEYLVSAVLSTVSVERNVFTSLPRPSRLFRGCALCQAPVAGQLLQLSFPRLG